MIALLLAAAALPTAIDAERAFATDAQKHGQWTAFNAWSTDDAQMFTPRPVNAHDFLRGRKNPPEAVKWVPAASFVSCDGTIAVNTGSWTGDGGKAVGFFTTVWKRQPNGGWKWTYDGGDKLTVARALPRKPLVRAASCEHANLVAKEVIIRPAAALPTAPRGYGRSADGTLFYSWTVTKAGARDFSAYLWNGQRYERVVDDQIAAPPK